MAWAYGLKRPFVKELHRSAPKWLKADAKPKYGNVRHGLDAQGVIHVVAQCVEDYSHWVERLPRKSRDFH
jgi:hypothetical protein